jgi:hypothetical protein
MARAGPNAASQQQMATGKFPLFVYIFSSYALVNLQIMNQFFIRV